MKKKLLKILLSNIDTTSMSKIFIEVDAWQAYCAGMTLRNNICKRGTPEYQRWKDAFLSAKDADKRGLMPGGYKKIPSERYWLQHPDKKPKEET